MQTAYDALEGNISRPLGGVESEAIDRDGSNTPVQRAVDLDAAVAFAR